MFSPQNFGLIFKKPLPWIMQGVSQTFQVSSLQVDIVFDLVSMDVVSSQVDSKVSEVPRLGWWCLIKLCHSYICSTRNILHFFSKKKQLSLKIFDQMLRCCNPCVWIAWGKMLACEDWSNSGAWIANGRISFRVGKVTTQKYDVNMFVQLYGSSRGLHKCEFLFQNSELLAL